MVVSHTLDGQRWPASLVDVLATNRLSGRAFTTMEIKGLEDTYGSTGTMTVRKLTASFEASFGDPERARVVPFFRQRFLGVR